MSDNFMSMLENADDSGGGSDERLAELVEAKGDGLRVLKRR